MKRITLKRLTSSDLAIMLNGERIGTAHQSPGNGRVYSAQIFGTEFSGLGQRDLIGRMTDWVKLARVAS